jgi:DNA transposition AAA+ family ATPase
MTELSTTQKTTIVTAMLQRKEKFAGSEKMYADSLGINPSVYNQLKNGSANQNLLSKAAWITLARKLDVALGNELAWKTVSTDVYKLINKQLEFCKENGSSVVYCDDADTGKTYAAKDFAKRNKNVVYVDCSLAKTKQLLVRKICIKLGIDDTGKYNDIKNDLCYYLKTLENPLIILDEFGDVDYNCFLEIKALWNATEYLTGWYAIGADGLKAKLERGRNNKKIGYAEFYRRFGSKYQKATPVGKDDKAAFINAALVAIAKANAPDQSKVATIVKGSNGSLTRVKTEIQKLLKQRA